MEVIDTVDAEMLEPGDVISYAGDEIEILESLDETYPDRVNYKVYNLSSGDVEPLSLKLDTRINLLGY